MAWSSPSCLACEIRVCISMGPFILVVELGVEPPPLLLPHASRNAARAVPDRPSAPARFKNSLRFCEEKKGPKSSCSRLLIDGYLHRWATFDTYSCCKRVALCLTKQAHGHTYTTSSSAYYISTTCHSQPAARCHPERRDGSAAPTGSTRHARDPSRRSG